jgi:hypothetical protein
MAIGAITPLHIVPEPASAGLVMLGGWLLPESVTLRAFYRGVWLTRSYASAWQRAGGVERRIYSDSTSTARSNERGCQRACPVGLASGQRVREVISWLA